MQRYDAVDTYSWPATFGEYVLHSEAQAEIARLTAEVERTNDVLEGQADVIRDLRAKLDTARNDAIEAAAGLDLTIILAGAYYDRAMNSDGPHFEMFNRQRGLNRREEYISAFCHKYVSQQSEIRKAILSLKRPVAGQ